MNAFASPSNAPQHYVLVIDDDPAIVDLLVALLQEDEGYTVRAAHSVRQVLEDTPLEPPSLILLDITLPGEKSDDPTPSLRRIPGWLDTPIVLCSGRDSLPEIAERVGAVAYLNKPFSLDDVTDLAHRYLSSYVHRRS